jgi:cytochrome c biogenesis protein CcdA
LSVERRASATEACLPHARLVHERQLDAGAGRVISGDNCAMLRLIGLVVSIGLADSMNPSTIAPTLYLAAGERPRTDVMQFTVGVFAVYFAGGAVFLLGPGQALLALVPHPGHTARYVVELVAGVVMLIAAGVLWRDREKLAHRKLPAPSTEGKSSALLGVTVTAVELPTAFPYFAAIAAIVASGLNPGRQLILLVLYNVCFVLPIIVTLAVAGDQAERVLERARDLVQKHWPALLAGLALLAGVFVTLLGVTGLASGGHGFVARLSRRFRRIVHH